MAGPLSWSNLFGRRMTRRLMRWILPDLMWNQEIYGQTVRRHIDNKTHWLDLGCGRRILGNDLEKLEDEMVATAASVVGCDMDAEGLRRHRNIQKRVLASIDELPFPGAAFNLITCNMVVEHLSNPARSFAEIVRVLSPGGTLIVHTPNLLNYMIFANHTMGRIVPWKLRLRLIESAERRSGKDVFPTYYRANTFSSISRIGAKLGLQVRSRRMLTPPQPFFGFFAPLAFFQILLMRLMMSRYFRAFGATMLIVFQSQPSANNDNSYAAPGFEHDVSVETTKGK